MKVGDVEKSDHLTFPGTRARISVEWEKGSHAN